MRKFAIAAVAAVGLMGAFGASGAAAAPGPCATVQSLFEKYKIELGMHQPEAEAALGRVCRTTG